MLSHNNNSEHMRSGTAVLGAHTEGRRISSAGPAWVPDVLETGLNRAKPRGFMLHSRPDISVARPENRRATGNRSAGWEGTVH